VIELMHRVHLVVQGRVQGVGYRYFVLRRAEESGLNGWVSNRADGAVETEVEGEREALERFVAALRQGPTGARVASVDERWSDSPARHTRFVIRPDLSS
jgi:acylphosphatase